MEVKYTKYCICELLVEDLTHGRLSIASTSQLDSSVDFALSRPWVMGHAIYSRLSLNFLHTFFSQMVKLRT